MNPESKKNIKDLISEYEEKAKKDFMKKTSKEKFENLYEDLSELEDRIENFNECCCNCDNEIEEIKFEQRSFLERIESLEYDVCVVEEEIKKLKKELKNKWQAQS